MKTIGVIPARYDSTRLKAKVLVDLLGKPLIQHVWEKAGQAKSLDDLMVACDDKRIEDAVKKFGGKAVLTSKDNVSGSDRIVEAVANLNVDIVVNIQGDEPLVHPTMIDDMVKALRDDKTAVMATVVRRLEDPKDVDNPNVVKVAIDDNNFALYFSRAGIPFNRDKLDFKEIAYWKHLGLYAYRKEFLMAFKYLPKSRLEIVEKLEQLRVLEAGYKIKTVETKYDTVAVDTAEDLKRVEGILKKK